MISILRGGRSTMKSYILMIISILLIIIYAVILFKFANTPVSEMPGWVFWLLNG